MSQPGDPPASPQLDDIETAAASCRLDAEALHGASENDVAPATTGDLRQTLHTIADLLADAFERRDRRPQMAPRATARRPRRRGVRVVPPATVVPDEIAAERAHQALRRAGLVKVRR